MTNEPSTTLCLLHRAHMPPASSAPNSYRVEEMAYPSRTIAFQAAGMITSIVENLQTHQEIRYAPAFMLVFPFKDFYYLLLTFQQRLQLVLGVDHARLPNAVISTIYCSDVPGENQHLHASLERRFQGLAGGEDGSHTVRVDLGQQSSRRTSSESCWKETSEGTARDANATASCEETGSAQAQIRRYGSWFAKRGSYTSGFIRTISTTDTCRHTIQRIGTTSGDQRAARVPYRPSKCNARQFAKQYSTDNALQRSLLATCNTSRSFPCHTYFAQPLSVSLGELPARPVVP